MKRFLSTLVFATAFLVGGCGDVTAPTAPPSISAPAQSPDGQPNALLGGLLGDLPIIGDLPIVGDLLGGDTVIVLQRRVALASDITVTKIIGSEGGTVTVPGAGLTVNVPAGALSVPTPITVKALAGRGVAYEFGPHGTQFAKPVRMTQDLRVTAVSPWAVPYMRFKAGYFSSSDNLLFRLLRAVVDELLPANADAVNMVVRFEVKHFSGYLVAVD